MAAFGLAALRALRPIVRAKINQNKILLVLIIRLACSWGSPQLEVKTLGEGAKITKIFGTFPFSKYNTNYIIGLL